MALLSKKYQFVVQQTEVKEEEEMRMKGKEEELRKVFQTAVSLCVHSGVMSPERAHRYYTSGETLAFSA